MANLKNWMPNMDPAEQLWFDACPKAVLFEIARQLASLCCDSCDGFEAAFARMQEEWAALHANGIVPQKPFDVEKAQAKIDAYLARRDALRAANVIAMNSTT